MAKAAVGDSAPGNILASSPASAEQGITNVQTAGVDEGGIVKRVGDYLLVLRRGRLFTVRVGGDQLQAVAAVDAFAPGSDPRGAWYDELLVSGSTVVVVGFSYARGGAELGLFTLGSDGGLSYRATYQLRSQDYFSTRNYASRLIGSQLVFYTPTVMQPWGPPWQASVPALRRWTPGLPADFQSILPATRIFRTDDELEPDQPVTLHSVTRCELGVEPMRCESTAVLGPAGRVFHVSATSVYVWTSAGRSQRFELPLARTSALFRLPLDGAAPSAIKTVGVPVDQMSFLEDRRGQLNVLLREAGEGEGMDGASTSHGRLALLRLPLSALGDGRSAAPLNSYTRLPDPGRGILHNRFVGDWLLWGGAQGAWALRTAQSGDAQRLPVRLPVRHEVERIEALGDNAILIGNQGADLQFSAVDLSDDRARVSPGPVLPGMRQGEARSHGFFYRSNGAGSGLLGLPVLSSDGAPAQVAMVRERNLSFVLLGALQARQSTRQDDGCKASCVDWYGNARPLFLGERVLALMGYEIVEGSLSGQARDERISERRRLDFSPQRRGRGNRPNPFD